MKSNAIPERTKKLEAYPSAKAPDHWRRKPSKADTRIADVLFTSHLKDNTPGGSSHGIKPNKNKIVTGVVFHINLLKYTARVRIWSRLLKISFSSKKEN